MSKGQMIFVVDDDADARDMVGDYLRSELLDVGILCFAINHLGHVHGSLVMGGHRIDKLKIVWLTCGVRRTCHCRVVHRCV